MLFPNIRELNIGFIGLGQMGRGMAENIALKGFQLSVYDARDVARNGFPSNVKVAENLKSLAENCQCIILSLPNHDIVERVLFDEDGVARYLCAESIVIDCGTSNPVLTKEIHKRLSSQTIKFIDAPVSGLPKRAKNGTLTIMVGCSEENEFTTVKPLLECMGTNVIHMGGPGTGQIAKAINNVFYNIACASIAELLPFSVKMGLDPEKIIHIVSTGTGKSAAIENFGPLILNRDFTSGYSMGSAYKDFETVIELMNISRIPLPVTMIAASTYQTALNKGLGSESKAAMIKIWEDLLGVIVKR
jgi:3-hydroxyisobutyrate dehydrogenase-like beta-hydroxyacid dehydrogenase